MQSGLKLWQAHLVLLLCAIIWGLAFVAQKDGMGAIGPMLFVGARFALALFTVLAALIIQRLLWMHGTPIWRSLIHHHATAPRILPTRREWKAGSFLGFFFVVGMISQQNGLVTTTVANSAFLTGLYVVLVPLLARVHGQRSQTHIWLATLLALAGIYLLCFPAGQGLSLASLNIGDALTILCALAWTFHVFYVGVLGHWGGVLRITAVQFFWAMTAGLLSTLAFEPVSLSAAWGGIQEAGWALAYTGILSGGVAFFLQMLGQKHAHAATSVVILSSEAFFGAVAGWWFLGETLLARAWLGGALMMLAMLMAQWQPRILAPQKRAS